MNQRAFQVRVQEDGRVWLISVDGVGVTQARRLDEVEAMSRDLVATVRDLDPRSIELTIEITLPGHVRALVDRAQARQGQAEAAQAEAGQLLRQAVRQLLDAGHTQRDAAHMLGISHQRVSQLAASTVAARRRTA